MEAPQKGRWRTQLTGWRGGLFALLGLYVVGTAAFLLAGGARPAMTSLVAMEAEVESGEVAVDAAPSTADDSPSPDSTEATSAEAAAPQAPAECSDINPVEHGVDTSLAGVHALGFVTLDEEPAAFSGYAGCALIVNFFASWCVPCVTEMPDFERFWNEHGAQVAVLGLAANDRLEDAIATVAERGVTYPTGLDEGELFIDFGGLGMPTTVFVSPEGQILETHSGLLTLEDITNRAEEHFGL